MTSDPDPRRSSAEASWKRIAPVLVLGLLIGCLYRELIGFDSIAPVVQNADGLIEGPLFVPNQKPVVLIFALAAFFFLSRLPALRREIGASPPSTGGFVAFGAGLALVVWAHLTREAPLALVSLALAVWGMAGVLGGAAAMRVVRLPTLFLLLAVPIPAVALNHLVDPLQQWTAESSGQLLSLLGVENVVSGETLYTDQAAFQVIEGCSGLRTIETLIMTAIVYQALVPHSRTYSWLLVFAAPPIGLFVNHLRVLLIVLNPRAGISEDHATQGIIMIVLATFMLIGVALALARLLPRSSATHRADRSIHATTWPWRRLAAVTTALLASLLATLGEPFEIERPEHRNPSALPGRFDGWRAKAESLDVEYFGSTRYDQTILRTYRRPGHEEVVVFLGVDTRREPLLSGVSPKHEVLGQSWEIVSERELVLDRSPDVRATASVQRDRDEHAYVVFWQQGIDSLPMEILRDVLALDRSPWQRPYDATAVRISTRFEWLTPDHEERALERLLPFVRLVETHFPAPE